MQSSVSTPVTSSATAPESTFKQGQEDQEQRNNKKVRTEEEEEELREREQAASSLQTFFQLKTLVMPRMGVLDRVSTCCALDDRFCPNGAIAAKIKLFLNELDEDLVVNGEFEKKTPKEIRDLILFQSELRSYLVDIEAGVPRGELGERWSHTITDPEVARERGGTHISHGALFFYDLLYNVRSVHEMISSFKYV